jgi:hypothetical protein
MSSLASGAKLKTAYYRARLRIGMDRIELTEP